jgi:arabinose-5-phosphate isomerase
LGAKLLQVSNLMHSGDELPIVRRDMTLSEGIVEMTSKRFGIAGVVDESGRLIGSLTDGDLRRAFRSGFVDCLISEAMGRSPHTADPQTLAVQALAHMNSFRITCIFVVSSGRPVGLVHIHDLLRAGVV